MKAPAGIQNLLVTITSDSNEFIGLISQMGLGETFDLANPGDLEDKLGGSLEDGSGIGLIDPNDPIKDKKEFIFLVNPELSTIVDNKYNFFYSVAFFYFSRCYYSYFKTNFTQY